jgi:hypothetical protein
MTLSTVRNPMYASSPTPLMATLRAGQKQVPSLSLLLNPVDRDLQKRD